LVEGFCHERFARVRDEFERNFLERGEVGAAVAIHLEGTPVVDLWGGLADPSTGQPWTKETVVVVFSSTKGMAAACLHVLIDRALLDLDAPISRYWPEFGKNGKANLTVAMALSHQIGLPLWQRDIPKDGLLDWKLATSALAEERPIWQPGTCHGYHGIAAGFLWGELVQRVTGITIGQFLQSEIARPLGAEVWIGLPESEDFRAANVILADVDPDSRMFSKLLADPDWIGGLMVNNVGHLFDPEMLNSRAFRGAELPSAGGVANARGLARLYVPLSLDGSVKGVRIVSPAALPLMRSTRSASSCDLMLQIATSFTYGFSKTWGRRQDGSGNYAILGEQAFGAPGMGGSIGFADGEARMAFGYTMNRLGGGVALNERGQSLIDAAYQALGYSSDAPGFWVR
jgi:CubicO group peptidase (beta-lactamase class C family)